MGFAEFGRYLTQQRELRGLSRDDMSRVTKIPPSLLQALEAGQVERLPEKVFILNYVRAYAHTLGLAEDEALLRFEEVEREAAQARAEAQDAVEKPRRSRRRVWAGLGVVLIAGLAAWWWTQGH